MESFGQVLLVICQVCPFRSFVPHLSEFSAKDCYKVHRCYESVWRNRSLMQPNLLSAPEGMDFPPVHQLFCAAVSVLSWLTCVHKYEICGFVGWGNESGWTSIALRAIIGYQLMWKSGYKEELSRGELRRYPGEPWQGHCKGCKTVDCKIRSMSCWFPAVSSLKMVLSTDMWHASLHCSVPFEAQFKHIKSSCWTHSQAAEHIAIYRHGLPLTQDVFSCRAFQEAPRCNSRCF
jgi:hypothetical protein